MKIALIYLGRRGGGPVYSLEVAKRLTKKSELLNIVSEQIDNLRYWGKADLSLLKISTYKSAFGLFFSFFNFKKFFFLYRQIKKFSPDVIYYPFFHFWDPIINFLFPKIPKVFTLHDPVLHQGERNSFVQFLQNRTVKQSNRIIVLSKAFKRTVAQQGIALEYIDYIPHGVFCYYSDVERSRAFTKAQETQDRNRVNILFFGRILEYKGLGVLLRAFPLIKKEVQRARLFIVGSGDLGPYQDILKEIGEADIEIENRWIADEEIGSYFARAHLAVCPYIEASQSGLIPLAYVFKVPVVATHVGGLKEQVEHGRTGLLVPPNDPLKFARACIEILKDSEKRKWMGEQGFNKAQREWNWDMITEKVLESLRKATH